MVNDIISISTYSFKETSMKNTISKQLLYEAETWKRGIVFMQSELVFMKNRISQILMEMPDRSMLDSIEHYQHIIIELEQSLDLFRLDITSQVELIKKNHEVSLNQLQTKLIKQKKLRTEIAKAEKLFNKMKFEFNQSFSTKLTKKVKE
jgi:hypothetical protein